MQHVLAHLVPNAGKAKHGVFNVGRKELLGLVDRAWLARGAPELGDAGAFVVRMGRTVGTQGENAIRLIVRPGTADVVTAYPVFLP